MKNENKELKKESDIYLAGLNEVRKYIEDFCKSSCRVCVNPHGDCRLADVYKIVKEVLK